VAPATPAAEAFHAPPIRFGDSWTVVVRSKAPEEEETPNQGAAWHFTAVGVRDDQIAVEARPVGTQAEPVTLLIDPRTGMMIRSRVVVPSNDGPKMIDRHYEPGHPCLADLSPVPFDRPAFPLAVPAAMQRGAAAVQETVYEATRPAEEGRVQFAGKTRQRVFRTDAKAAAKLIARPEPGVPAWKGKLPAAPRCRVELIGAGRGKVEQLWAAGIPWPVYSASSTARCWLVDFKRGSTEGMRQ